ncbi:MAG: hypothetical protein QOG02_1596 [Gaiellales bacterium]|nr:hypothetical protein [Gaiellales bacterium]
MTTVAIRIYTAIVALVCTAALAFALSARDTSGRWREQVAYWERTASRSQRHDRATARRIHDLSIRYNHLVAETRRSQAAILRALRLARSQGTSAATTYTQGTVYHTVSVSGASAPTTASGGGSPDPTPVNDPPPPTTTAS